MCEDMAGLALNMLDEVKAAINCLKDKTYLDTDGLPSMFFFKYVRYSGRTSVPSV